MSEEEYGGDDGYGDEPMEEQPQEEYGQEEPVEEEPAGDYGGGDDGGYEEAGGGDYKEPVQEEEEEEEAPAQYTGPSGSVPSFSSIEDAWQDICSDKNAINWFLCSVTAKTALEYSTAGNGGLSELKDFLASSSSEPYFGLLRVNGTDKGGSVRAKFIYIRFVGSTVKFMRKAKLTPQLGKFGDHFPVKHMTLDISDKELDDKFTVAKLSKEFLRVGGAHKPDSYIFGPGQVYKVQ